MPTTVAANNKPTNVNSLENGLLDETWKDLDVDRDDCDSVASHSSSKSRKRMNRPFIPIMEVDPSLPEGWKRCLKMRMGGKKMGKIDVSIESPSGRKFKTRAELAGYLEKISSPLDPLTFDFTLRGREFASFRNSRGVDSVNSSPAKSPSASSLLHLSATSNKGAGDVTPTKDVTPIKENSVSAGMDHEDILSSVSPVPSMSSKFGGASRLGSDSVSSSLHSKRPSATKPDLPLHQSSKFTSSHSSNLQKSNSSAKPLFVRFDFYLPKEVRMMREEDEDDSSSPEDNDELTKSESEAGSDDTSSSSDMDQPLIKAVSTTANTSKKAMVQQISSGKNKRTPNGRPIYKQQQQSKASKEGVELLSDSEDENTSDESPDASDSEDDLPLAKVAKRASVASTIDAVGAGAGGDDTSSSDDDIVEIPRSQSLDHTYTSYPNKTNPAAKKSLSQNNRSTSNYVSTSAATSLKKPVTSIRQSGDQDKKSHDKKVSPTGPSFQDLMSIASQQVGRKPSLSLSPSSGSSRNQYTASSTLNHHRSPVNSSSSSSGGGGGGNYRSRFIGLAVDPLTVPRPKLSPSKSTPIARIVTFPSGKQPQQPQQKQQPESNTVPSISYRAAMRTNGVQGHNYSSSRTSGSTYHSPHDRANNPIHTQNQYHHGSSSSSISPRNFPSSTSTSFTSAASSASTSSDKSFSSSTTLTHKHSSRPRIVVEEDLT